MLGVVNHMRAVDLLQSLPEVDGERIGVVGHSLGGHNSMFVAAFDQRIKCIVSNCGFCSFPTYIKGNIKGWSHDGYMPRLKTVFDLDPAKVPFDFTEVTAALAPRAFLGSAPLRDHNFDVAGRKRLHQGGFRSTNCSAPKRSSRAITPTAITIFRTMCVPRRTAGWTAG